jgi:hypothetical protein
MQFLKLKSTVNIRSLLKERLLKIVFLQKPNNSPAKPLLINPNL